MYSINKQANKKRKALFRRLCVGISRIGREFGEGFWTEIHGLENIE